MTLQDGDRLKLRDQILKSEGCSNNVAGTVVRRSPKSRLPHGEMVCFFAMDPLSEVGAASAESRTMDVVIQDQLLASCVVILHIAEMAVSSFRGC